MKNKISSEERDVAIGQYPKLQNAIESGSWEYSPSKLKSDFDAFRFTTWVQVHPFLTALIFVTSLAMGGIPAIVFIILLVTQKAGRERYEVALHKLKHNQGFNKAV